MRIRETISTLLEHPTLELYRCEECGSHLGPDHDTCPDCGGEDVTATPQTDMRFYWDGI